MADFEICSFKLSSTSAEVGKLRAAGERVGFAQGSGFVWLSLRIQDRIREAKKKGTDVPVGNVNAQVVSRITADVLMVAARKRPPSDALQRLPLVS